MTEKGTRAEPRGGLWPDTPVARRDGDRLTRAPLATAIAEHIAAGPPGEGWVIGLTGQWGSGKTSMLNMIEERLELTEVVVIHFNPWMYSDAEELVVRFLDELANQLRAASEEASEQRRERLARAGTTMGQYAQSLEPLSWLPFVGGWMGRISSVGKAAEKLAQRRRESPGPSARKDAVKASLADLEHRLLVVIDDLDRVEANHIRDIVRMVKLVADFPNVTYLLAFDVQRVAQALGETPADGHAYLEKIVQVLHAVPEASPVAIRTILAEQLNDLLAISTTGPFHGEDWQNIAGEGLFPLFNTVRDVRRYLNALPVTLQVVGTEVAVVDVLALEAVRVFAPESYALLGPSIDVLCGNASNSTMHEPAGRTDEKRQQVAEIVRAAGRHERAVEEILRRLFPAASSLLGESVLFGGSRAARVGLRVAHPDVLRAYLHKTLPAGSVPGQLVSAFMTQMTDQARLEALVDDLDSETLQALLIRLLDYEQEFVSEGALPGVVVLLNQLPGLPEGRAPLGDDAEMQVGRLTLRLLRAVPDESERLSVVEAALPQINTLSGQMELIDTVGHRENVGHGLVSKPDSDRLYDWLDRQVREASASQLSQERQLAQLFLRVEPASERIGVIEKACRDDRVFVRLLRSGLSETVRQTLGEHATQRRPALPYELFAEWLGKAELDRRIAELLAGSGDDLSERDRLGLETAAKYAGGEYSNRMTEGWVEAEE